MHTYIPTYIYIYIYIHLCKHMQLFMRILTLLHSIYVGPWVSWRVVVDM